MSNSLIRKATVHIACSSISYIGRMLSAHCKSVAYPMSLTLTQSSQGFEALQCPWSRSQLAAITTRLQTYSHQIFWIQWSHKNICVCTDPTLKLTTGKAAQTCSKPAVKWKKTDNFQGLTQYPPVSHGVLANRALAVRQTPGRLVVSTPSSKSCFKTRSNVSYLKPAGLGTYLQILPQENSEVSKLNI